MYGRLVLILSQSNCDCCICYNHFHGVSSAALCTFRLLIKAASTDDAATRSAAPRFVCKTLNNNTKPNASPGDAATRLQRHGQFLAPAAADAQLLPQVILGVVSVGIKELEVSQHPAHLQETV
jgi:hypothetical protein